MFHPRATAITFIGQYARKRKRSNSSLVKKRAKHHIKGRKSLLPNSNARFFFMSSQVVAHVDGSFVLSFVECNFQRASSLSFLTACEFKEHL